MSVDHPRTGRSGADRVAAVLTAGAVGAAAITAVTAAATTVLVARAVITPPTRRVEDTRVLGVADGAVRLSRSPDATVPGDYSFWFDDGAGHARLGRIVAHDERSVTREILGVDRGDLAGARHGRFAGWYHLGPEGLGVPFEDVDVPTELGPAPAWVIPAAQPTDRWVLVVHGWGVRRQEGLRAVPAFREEGYTTMLLSYRNDVDAPRSADHRYALGSTEWRDVDAAMRLAVDRGAREIVLMGWSMGGAIVLQTVTRSELAPLVTGVVLESPVVDWLETLEFQARERRVPAGIRQGAVGLLTRGWARRVLGHAQPIDFTRLDFVRRAIDLDVPVLLLHSDDDGFVPSGSSHLLARSRPDIVTFERFDVARHTKLWNYDRPRWERAVRDWLARLD